MSTICKLDPRVRRDRSARAELLRSMGPEIAHLIRMTPPGSDIVPKAIAASHLLERIASSSRRTGAAKQRLFTTVARELAGLMSDVVVPGQS